MGTAAMFNAMASALGTIGAAQYPDTVTFKSTGTTQGTSGGKILGAVTSNTPINVPVRSRPVSGSEVELARKMTSKAAYMLFVPATFSSSLVNVDAKDTAVIAARSGGEPSRTFTVQTIGRNKGLEIEILASLEE